MPPMSSRARRPRSSRPISIDHPEFLGSTVDKIAYEKAGIFKRGALAILSTQEDAALAVLDREARRMGAPVIAGGRDYNAWEENGRLVFEDARGLLDLPPPHLIGRHQHQNAATAIAALRAIEPHLAPSAFEDGLTGAQWPARLQNLAKGHVGGDRPGRLRDLARRRPQ